MISKSSLEPNYTAHLTASNLLSASRYLPTWLIPYMLLASVADMTRMTKTFLIPQLTHHPRCLTSLMLSLLQPSIYLTLLPVLHHLLPPFLPTALRTTQLPSHLALRTPLWRRQSFQQTLTLLACGDHLALDVVLRVLKIMILNYSLCY